MESQPANWLIRPKQQRNDSPPLPRTARRLVSGMFRDRPGGEEIAALGNTTTTRRDRWTARILRTAFGPATLTLILVTLAPISAKTGEAPRCPPIPAANADCTDVNTYSDLRSVLSGSKGEADFILCPFHVTRREDDDPIVIKRSVSVSCVSKGDCEISGPGTQMKVYGPSARLSVWGLTFQGATGDGALLFLPNVKGEHSICNSSFLNNASTLSKGGAVMIHRSKASVYFDECSFVENYGKSDGGAIYNRAKLYVEDCVFNDNSSKDRGGAIANADYAVIDVRLSSFEGNISGNGESNAIAIWNGKGQWTNGGNNYNEDESDTCLAYNIDDRKCQAMFDRHAGARETAPPQIWTAPLISFEFIEVPQPVGGDSGSGIIAIPGMQAFQPGDLIKTDSITGLRLARGLSVRVIAVSGNTVRYDMKNGNTRGGGGQSDLVFHKMPDGAACLPVKGSSYDEGDYAYISNAEVQSGGGGVYALIFDRDGRVKGYEQRLVGTTRNCSGGITPWNTWISCEEYSKGKCWQVDPSGGREPETTDLVEEAGGNFESVAYDDRNPEQPLFFTTEDHPQGALRRFKPELGPSNDVWETLHRGTGQLDYLKFVSSNQFTWTTSLKDGRRSAYDYYQNSEGIVFKDGKLVFVAKKLKKIFILNLDTGYYTSRPTNGKLFGDGSFNDGPDQIQWLPNNMIYYTEDGGSTPGIYAGNVNSGTYYAIMETVKNNRHNRDETTGLAFSPDFMRMYCCMQDEGTCYEFTRDDGFPFTGTIMN